MTRDEAADLQRAVDRLIGHVRHWQPVRWSRPTADGAMSRADRMHLLAQRLADAAADAERRPRRSVPRLGSVLALSDQVRVLADDVLAAVDAPVALAALVTEVRSAAAALD